MIDEMIAGFQSELNVNITKTLNENEKGLSNAIINIEIIQEISNNIEGETGAVLKEIIHDLISGLYSGLQALYRNAYISLRSGIELSLAYIYFVDHNYDFLYWKIDKYDVKWSVLSDSKKGVLSQEYLSMFSNDDFSTLFEQCREIYRSCSQFVHGKYEYMHTVRQQTVKYDQVLFEKYVDMYEKLGVVIISLLLIRHSNMELRINEVYKVKIEECLKRMNLKYTLDKIKECWN